MTDKKFLAQLNLYLDGEIDAVEAAELEHEILSNPARRRIYNDYCRIHRATKLVCEQFRAAGAVMPPERTASRAVITAMQAPGGRLGGRALPRPFRVALFAGGLAAACATGVFVGTQALAPRTPADQAPAVVVKDTPAPSAVQQDSATAQPVAATFPAPFVPEVRQDPFVQTKKTPGDPFALTPWASTHEDFARLLPTGLPEAPALKVDPRFQPASLQQGVGPKPTGERENRPFRTRMNDEESSSTAPAEFGAQP